MLISLTVGKVDAGVAVLLTEDKRLVRQHPRATLSPPQLLTLFPHQIEFPSILLPPSITSGSIVDINVARNTSSEATAQKAFASLQSSILTTYGLSSPKPPVLRCRNATQTSIVLEWDKLDLATATLRSLSLYRDGAKAGSIPYYPGNNPARDPVQSTKISGLAVDTQYTFHLLLRTSAGTYSSEKLRINTQKMTDLTGVTITPGPMPPPLLDSLKTAIERIGMKFADTVRIDTTHFVCTEGRGPEWEKAKELNVPVVRPEWVEGCEREGRIVGVRGYYLGADPKKRQVGPGVVAQQHSPQPQQQQGSSQSAAQQDLQRREAEAQALAMRQREKNAEEEDIGAAGGAKTNGAGGAQDSPLPPPTPAKDDYRPAGSNAAGVPSSADDESEEDDDAEEQRGQQMEKTPQARADDESEDGELGEGEKTATGDLSLGPPAGKEGDEEEEEGEEGGRTPGGGEGFSEVAL